MTKISLLHMKTHLNTNIYKCLAVQLYKEIRIFEIVFLIRIFLFMNFPHTDLQDEGKSFMGTHTIQKCKNT